MFNKTKGKMLSAMALVLSLVMTAPVIIPQVTVVAEAATKTSAWVYDNEIGVNATTKIYLEDKKAKASYRFSSSKKSIASVSKKGVITGVKPGTANITVSQKYKGKTSKIKTFKIRVKQAKVFGWLQSKDNGCEISLQPGWVSKENPANMGKPSECVTYRNPKAKYAFYSDSKNLVISKDGKVTSVKKGGTTNLIIKETYKGKTRAIGKIPVALKEPSYTGKDTIQLYLGDKFIPGGDAEYQEDEKPLLYLLGKYSMNVSKDQQSDEDIIKGANDDSDGENNEAVKFELNSKGEWNGKLLAQKEGTVYCTITEWNYLEKKYDKVIGRFKIVVSDASKLTDLQLPWEREKTDNDDEESYSYDKAKNTVQASLYANSYGETGGISLFMKQVPSVYYGDYKVTSSNDKVVSAAADQDEVSFGPSGSSSATNYDPLYEWPENRHEDGMYLNLVFHKAGKAIITVEAGGVKKSFTVNVVDDGDEDY